MRRIKDTYYLVYSSQAQHELCYATSRYPDRDFTYQGVIISNGDIGLNGNQKAANYIGTNHGGLVQIRDELYIFYHRNTHGLATSRQGCAEKLTFGHDGRILQAGISSYGLYGRPFSEKRSYSAFEACYLECLDTAPRMKIKLDYKNSEPCYIQDPDSKTPHYITGLRNRCLFGYNAFDLKTHAQIALTVRGQAAGSLVVSADRNRTVILGQETLQPSAHWTKIPIALSNPSGVTKLYVTFFGEGSLDVLSLTLL